jgi:hypothetical protein
MWMMVPATWERDGAGDLYPNGSAEAAVLRLLTDRSEGLGACKSGRPGDVRIIAVGPLPGRQGVWMIAARPPLPPGAGPKPGTRKGGRGGAVRPRTE